MLENSAPDHYTVKAAWASGPRRDRIPGLASPSARALTVTELDADDIEEVYDLRVLLEGHAVRLAVPLMTDEDLQILEALYGEMIAAEPGDAQLAARERFYIRLYSITGRPRLVNLISRLRQEVARSLRWPTLQHAPEHHEAFFVAIRAGDAERAASQLASHYRRVAILIRRYLRDASVSERQRPRAIPDIDLER